MRHSQHRVLEALQLKQMTQKELCASLGLCAETVRVACSRLRARGKIERHAEVIAPHKFLSTYLYSVANPVTIAPALAGSEV